MQLMRTIDGLLVGARYLAWGIALVCIPLSVVLLAANLAVSVGAVFSCVAALLLAVGVTALLLPASLAKGPLASPRRIPAGAVLVVLAAVAFGITYLACGGFPPINLIFA